MWGGCQVRLPGGVRAELLKMHPSSPIALLTPTLDYANDHDDGLSLEEALRAAARQRANRAMFVNNHALWYIVTPMKAEEPTPFQYCVWEQVKLIPPGETWTFDQVAEELGRPSAGKAVAAALAIDPHSALSLSRGECQWRDYVPGHRVVPKHGKPRTWVIRATRR